jgi:hypothetical protein
MFRLKLAIIKCFKITVLRKIAVAVSSLWWSLCLKIDFHTFLCVPVGVVSSASLYVCKILQYLTHTQKTNKLRGP